MSILKLNIKSAFGDFTGDLTAEAMSDEDCRESRDKLQSNWLGLRYLVIYPERGNPQQELLIPAHILEQSVCLFSIENPPNFKKK